MPQSFESDETGCYVLGVDGGGTKTDAWLARGETGADPVVIGRGRAGSSNPRAVGMSTALANLGAAVDAAWQDAGKQRRQVHNAVLALSGGGHPEVQEEVLAWVCEQQIAHAASIVHDADPLLAAGTPEGWGVALIVGTGSAAIAVDSRGRREVVGGWGYWFGDEGSAFWIGRRALEAVARAADGRGDATLLTAAIGRRLEADHPRAMLGELEKSGNVRGAIASLAEEVAHAAATGDQVALTIVNQAAEELARMVQCAASRLELGREFPLSLGGGVAVGSELLCERLAAALHAKSLAPLPVETVPYPVAGCIKLAWQAMQKPSPIADH